MGSQALVVLSVRSRMVAAQSPWRGGARAADTSAYGLVSPLKSSRTFL